LIKYIDTKKNVNTNHRYRWCKIWWNTKYGILIGLCEKNIKLKTELIY